MDLFDLLKIYAAISAAVFLFFLLGGRRGWVTIKTPTTKTTLNAGRVSLWCQLGGFRSLQLVYTSEQSRSP